MNLPNKLTILRILLVPVYVVFFLVEITDYHYLIATGIFIIASITDLLDGKIARKRKLVTDFGKFADPLADKLLVISALICFVEKGFMPAWACIIIVARELAISGFRLVLSSNGHVLAASMWGKVKTVFQMIFVIFTSLNLPYYLSGINGLSHTIEIICSILMYIVIALTVVSLIDYFVKNKGFFDIKN